jgi:predicted secreted hydrolase
MKGLKAMMLQPVPLHQILDQVAARASELTGVSEQEIRAEIGDGTIHKEPFDIGGHNWSFVNKVVSAQVRVAVEQAAGEVRLLHPTASH